MVTFNHPEFLVAALLLVPGFLIISVLVHRLQTKMLGKFGKRQTLSRFSRFAPKMATTLVFSISISLLALAAADPVLESSQDASSRTLNAIIVMDVSRSMLAEDGPQNKSRLETGILAVEKLLETYPDGRFGLVTYTNNVTVYQPTSDHQAIRLILRDILNNYHIRGEGSTPRNALRDTGTMIEKLPTSVGTIILISDGGRSLSSGTYEPPRVQTTQKLRELGVRILAVGVGGFVPSAIPVYAPDRVLVGYHEFLGEVVYTSLEENLLRQFAEETSGWYVRLESPDNLLTTVRSQGLDSEPLINATATSIVWLPVAVSLLLLAMWQIISAIYPRFS